MSLRSMELSALPVHLFKMTFVKELDLSRNFLEIIPEGIVHLQHIRVLRCSKNVPHLSPLSLF